MSTFSDTEVWLPIPDFEGYEVSTHGRVRSWRPCRNLPVPRVLAPWPEASKGIHQKVNLMRDGKRWPLLVHRLTLAVHVGPPPADRPITRHLDGDPTNNHLSNICYGTYSENEFDAVRHGTHNNSSKTHCKQGHPFDEANTLYSTGGRHRSCRACNRIKSRRRRAA